MSTANTPLRRPLWLILWGALTAAPVIYAVLAQTIAISAQPLEQWPLFRLVFIGLAPLGFAFASFIMTRASGASGANGWPPAVG